jgi:hypothetical protein
MKENTLIRLTEIVKKGDETENQQCLINREGIVGVFEFTLTPDGIPIVKAEGTDYGRKVRAINLTNGRTVYVEETIDKIMSICTPDSGNFGPA